MHTYMARVRRTELPGGTGESMVTLELIEDEDTVEVHQGDEFVTVQMKVDPFKPA